MNVFEKIGTDPDKANEQLQGFALKGTQEELQREYDGLFDGIESEALDALFQEFREVMEDAPDDIVEQIMAGDTRKLAERASRLGWAETKIKQLIIFALIGASVSLTSHAFAQGKEEVLHDLETVRSRVYIPKKIQFRGKDLTIAPVTIQESAESRLVRVTNRGSVSGSTRHIKMTDEQNNPQHSRFSINGQPATVIHQDSERTVFGNSDSIYKKNGDGEVAVGVIIVE